MEAVGAVASIIGIVGAGAKLSITLFDFASTIGSAGAEVRAIGTEISLFCSVLKQLERTLTKANNKRYSISAIEATQEILDTTTGVLGEIEDIINGIQKHKGQSTEPTIDLTAKIKWTLRKRSKIQRHRAMLESCKITLHIMLTTLDFARKLSSRRISTIETDLEDEQEEMMTQSLVLAQRSAVDGLERAETDHEADLDEEPESLDEPPPYTRRRAITGDRVSDRRNSAWLHDLLSDSTLDADTRRLSAQITNSKIHQLPQFLWKWTDQGKHWNDMHTLPSAGAVDALPLDNPRFHEPGTMAHRHDTFPLSPGSTEAPTPRDHLSPPAQAEYFPLLPHSSLSPGQLKRTTRKAPPPLLPLSQKTEPTPPSSSHLPSPSPSPMNATFQAEVHRSTPRHSPSMPRFQRSPTNPNFSHSFRAQDDSNFSPVYKNRNMRIERDKTCENILPEIMKLYGLKDDPKEYQLFLKTDDPSHLRQLEDSEMPLKLLKTFKNAGKHPEFQLRKVNRYPTPIDIEAWV